MTQKLGKSPNFGVIYEIQRAKFGVFIFYILEAKFGAPTRISEAKFGAKPPIIILKVRTFQQPTANRFSTARQKPVGGTIGLRISPKDTLKLHLFNDKIVVFNNQIITGLSLLSRTHGCKHSQTASTV